MHTVIAKAFTFEASHQLIHHSGQCRNLHGHSYKLLVFARGVPKKVDPSNPKSDEGMVMDYGDLSQIVHKHVIDVVDHTYLNHTTSITVTTAELIAAWALTRLHEADNRIFKVRVSETASTFAEVEVDKR